MNFKSIDEVVAWRACVGCGACSYLSGEGIRMRNIPEVGHRPVRTGAPLRCSEADLLAVCPGAGTELASARSVPGVSAETIAANGPTLEVWEGHAADPELRHSGSSGGALSALAAYCLQQAEFHGVLHVGPDLTDPYRNRTVMSHSLEDLRKTTGSRYAPASVCDGLQMIEDAPGPCLFIGQPSEVAALRKAQGLRPGLGDKVGLALSFFCAGSPPTQATVNLIRSHGIDPEEVTQIRYRGRGWPGNFAVWVKGKPDPVVEMTYADSWAILQAMRPWSTQIWPDGSGEHADITCGDPWYREVKLGEPGSSLVVVRTELGRRMLHAAMEAGFLSLTRIDESKLLGSQKNLIHKKGAVWGRLLAMRLLGIPAPRHRGYKLFAMWQLLSLRDKASSIFGTVRRILQRGYRKPENSLKQAWNQPDEVSETGAADRVSISTGDR